LAIRQVQRDLGGVGGDRRGLQALGVLQGRQGVGDVLEGREHRRAVLLAGLDVGRLGGLFLMHQGAALEDRRGDGRAQVPEAQARAEHMAEGERGAAGVAGELDIGQPVGDGDADAGAGGMHVGLGLHDVRPLLDQGRGQAERQVLRQGQAGQVDDRRRRLAGELAGEHGQEVVLLRKLGQQRRQAGVDAGQLGALRGHIQFAHIALGELVVHRVEDLGVDLDQLLRRIDLGLQGRLLDGGVGDVGGQGQIGRQHLVARGLFLGLDPFQGAAAEAEDVRRIGDAHLGREEVVLDGVRAGHGAQGFRRAAARRRKACRDIGREERSTLGAGVFLGDP
jgi:hypothetical protein